MCIAVPCLPWPASSLSTRRRARGENREGGADASSVTCQGFMHSCSHVHTSEYQQRTWRQRQDHVCMCIRGHMDNTGVVFATSASRFGKHSRLGPDEFAQVPNFLFGGHPVARVRIYIPYVCMWPCVNQGGHQGRTRRRVCIVSCGCSLLFHAARVGIMWPASRVR